MSRGTETMDRVAPGSRRASNAGLLLLCAKDFARIPRAIVLRGSHVIVGRERPLGREEREPTQAHDDSPREYVCIPQPAISRVHARLERTPDGWDIEDRGSRNGTFVDGRRISRTRLEEGSLVRVGDTLFKFVAEGIEDHWPHTLHDDPVAPLPGLVGGLLMTRIAGQVERAARTDLSVLVVGETGTGKELVASALHGASGRPGAMASINCAAVPAHLFESELFGHRKGAFTGADRDKLGLLQSADQGTVHLDEIGDMPLELQAKLLRVLESHEVHAVGALRPEPVDLRFVSTTHRDLSAMVTAGRFRSDLLARINGVTISLPPLRRRKEDLRFLVRHFLAAAGQDDLDASFPFLLALCDYEWPHNVRECEATVRRAVAMMDGTVLQVDHLPSTLRDRVSDYGDRAETAPTGELARRAIPGESELRRLMTLHAGNVAAVARDLGKDRSQVNRLLARHAIVPGEYRKPRP